MNVAQAKRRIRQLEKERDEWQRIAEVLLEHSTQLRERLTVTEEMVGAVHRLCVELGIDPMRLQEDSP